MDDAEVLTKLNRQFIEAFRHRSWELLEPILSRRFSYLDGATGEVWTHERYVAHLRSHAAPALAIDQVVVHVDMSVRRSPTTPYTDGRSGVPGGIQ